MAAALLVFGTLESGVFAYVDNGLHRPATFVGVLVTVMGIGSIAGGLLAPRAIRRVGEPATIAAGLLSVALGLGPLTYPNVGVGLAAVPFAGLGVSLVVVAFATLMQRRTPQTIIGRVSTASDLLIGVPQTGSIAAGAILVSTVDYRWMFATATVGLTAVATALWIVRNRDATTVSTPPDIESAPTRQPVGRP
jgi:MFS family permease